MSEHMDYNMAFTELSVKKKLSWRDRRKIKKYTKYINKTIWKAMEDESRRIRF